MERFPRTFGRLEREMEELFEKFLGREEREGNGMGMMVPKTNVAETDGEFEVTVDLPGLKPQEFNVEFREGALWITGEKKEEKEEKGKTFHRMERRYGQFQRVIPLPTKVNEGKIAAEYKEGVLKVTVPKVEALKPKKIEVKT
jgi:HSP20 family protein